MSNWTIDTPPVYRTDAVASDTGWKVPLTRAKGVFTLTSTGPADAETVVIGGKTYTFKTSLSNTDGYVKIGTTLDASLRNLAAAINLDAGAGTTYAAATTLNAYVEASVAEGKLNVTAKEAGTEGNSIATTDTVNLGSWVFCSVDYCGEENVR